MIDSVAQISDEVLGPVAGQSFFSSSVSKFLASGSMPIVGRLSSGHASYHASIESEQFRAWTEEIAILREALPALGGTEGWSVLIEVPLLRLGKRLDAVLLGPGVVVVIEFKIGATMYHSADRAQTENYAQSLQDFHEVSQSRNILPILCAEKAPDREIKLKMVDRVAEVVLANAQTLGIALRLALELIDPAATGPDPTEFEQSPYRPTPTIIDAARSLYAGHEIADIGRGDAADEELQAASRRLQSIAADAEKDREHVICFITGAPGAGKTLLGLDLALKGQVANRPAALLSGNRPLVHVLTEALAEDRARRERTTKAQAQAHAKAAIQNLLGYLKEHTDRAVPPEPVIVFDEAQRAWDEQVGQELMGRPASEPQLFLDILGRLEWSCLVCLVGTGQEINRGEGGLPLWGKALAQASDRGLDWRVIAAPEALAGGRDISGQGLSTGMQGGVARVQEEPELHLRNAIRAYRNPAHGRWVSALLQGEIERAAELARTMQEPPAFLCRDIGQARAWLKARRRAGRSVGLLASSGAVRLVGDGVPPAPRSNELGTIGHWFLKPYTDFRSSSALEVPMSEFGCQGLELDYVGLCWGGDLIWSENAWLPRMMRAPRWQRIRDQEKHRFRVNGYRVLLTRARAGSVIFVPPGDGEDPTRIPAEMDATAAALVCSGCLVLHP